MSEKELYRITDNQSQFSAAWKSLILISCFFASFFIGTEYCILKTGREGFYEPFSLIFWACQAKVHGERLTVYMQGMQITIVCLVASFLIVHTVSSIMRRKVKESDLHGSSRFAGYDDLKKAGFLDNKGLYFGGWHNKKQHCIEYLQDNSPTHIIVVAPPRSGKGVGFVVPNLLTFEGSVIVFDLKGENYHLTSGHRKSALNNVILRFDPTSDNPNSAKYNPLSEVRMGLHEFGDAQAIAEMMIDPNKKGDTDHWRRSAVSLLVCTILHTLYARRDKTLTGVVTLLSDPKRPIYEVLDSMLGTIHDPSGKQNWKDPTTGELTKTHPIIASMAREFKNKGFEEMSGIVSTALAYLTLYRDPIIAKNTSQSDFTIQDIIKSADGRPRAVYFNVPPSNLQRMVPLTRLFINQVLVRIMENKNLVLHDSENTNHRLLMMLDEFNALGKMDNLKDSLSFAAQYGVRVCLIVQDLDQINELYGEKNPLLSYCHIRIFHATNSDFTAKRISGLAGEQTIVKYSKSYSDNNSNVSESASEIMRPLMKSDEAQRLPKDEMLIFVEGQFPIRGKKIIYYEDASFKKMILPPVEKSDVLPVNNEYSKITDVVEFVKPKDGGPTVIYRPNPGLGIATVSAADANDHKDRQKRGGIVLRNEIRLVGTKGEALLQKLIDNDIVEGASDGEVRIVGDLYENKAKIAGLAGEDFEALWRILKQSHNKNEQ